MTFRTLCAFAVGTAAALSMQAKEAYIPISGSVGVFRTDARIWNPSGIKEIVVTASFWPAGTDNTTTAPTRQITIGRRAMVVLDDVVTTQFNSTGLGAIRLSSPDDFVATSRIYATSTAGTLGQFAPALDSSLAKTKGVMIQLKSTGGSGQAGTFRTNLGFVNPNSKAATLTLRRYDANNTALATSVIDVPPSSVIFPVTLDPASGNLSNAWVSYESSQSIFGFASIIDNGTTDPTFVPASEDTGNPEPASDVTRLYLSPISNFKLSTNPTAATTASQVCASSSTWTATLSQDMIGKTFKASLGTQTESGSPDPSAAMFVDIFIRRGSGDFAVFGADFSTTPTYQVQTSSFSLSNNTTARAGETLVFRVRRSRGASCVVERVGPGTDNFIEVPKTAVAN